MGVVIQESETVDCPISEVFAAIADLDTLPKYATDLSDVQADFNVITGVGQNFQATKTIHDRTQQQTYSVSVFDAPNRYSVRTTLFKMPVSYEWELRADPDGRTVVSLTKSAQPRGWSKIFTPLLRHLLSRPEHDRFLLQNLIGIVSARN